MYVQNYTIIVYKSHIYIYIYIYIDTYRRVITVQYLDRMTRVGLPGCIIYYSSAHLSSLNVKLL